MPLDPSGLGAISDPRPISWTAKDCALYALGVGAGVDELAFTTDNTRDVPARMLPTMPVTLGTDTSVFKALGEIDWVRLLHAEQHVELLAPLPVKGSGTARTRIAELWDKEKAAVIVAETSVSDDAGVPLFRSRMSLFVKGAGGWGGERGPSSSTADPEDKPDDTVTYVTRPDQALIYRLSGDRNPLHSDPAFAAKAGFPRPILHGLCTFGFAGRAVLHSAAGGDPDRVRAFGARFAAVVFPGDTLHVDLWRSGSEVRFLARREDGTVVLSQGRASIA
ncbi:MAG: MaoC/PaaZ C-terminal domain-containing protein [Sporichthyaceae bacterium]